MRIFRNIHTKLNWSYRRYVAVALLVLGAAYVASAIYHTVKPLPAGLNYASPLRHAEVEFLADQTYVDMQGQQQQDQQIFKQMLALIDQAQTTIVLDQFLFNPEVGQSTQQHQALTQQLTQALIQKRQQNPNIEIKFITDPINSVYGGILPEHYRQLRQAGVDVIETNLAPLRASNPVWSGFWYFCCQGLRNNPQAGWLPNPVGEGKVTLRSYMDMANFKANHRKTMVVDTPQGWKTLVSSMNPHDGSSRHSNVALLVTGKTAVEVLKTEQVVGQISQANMPMVILGEFEAENSQPQVQVLTEKAIYDQVLKLLRSSNTADIKIDLAMFYLSEREIIQELIAAHQRGVQVRVLLDPNKDAFGRSKNGIPNRPVAAELHQAGIQVRWCDTQGEQCHSKMLLKKDRDRTHLILGSANFTARNLKNYNLETDLHVVGSHDSAVFQQAQRYFNTAWDNLEGKKISVDYPVYADESKLKYVIYRLMEWTGISTF